MLVQDLESPIDQIKWTSTVSSRIVTDISASRYYRVIVRSAQPEVQPGDVGSGRDGPRGSARRRTLSPDEPQRDRCRTQNQGNELRG